MLPYHPNSDALLPPPAPPPLPAEPVFPAPLSADDLVFVLFFFSLLASVCSPVDFCGVDLGCADDLVAFASTVFLGVGFGVGFGAGFGVGFGLGASKAFGVATGVAFGVDKSISLFA